MSIKDTLYHFKNYLGATVATKALTLISIPVLTKWLGVTPEDYGYVSLFTTYVGIFICLVTLNTYVGAGRYYYEQRSDFKEFFGTTVNLNILLLVVVCSTALMFVGPISQWLDITPWMSVLMFPSIVFSIGSSLFVQLFSAKQQSGKIARYSIATAYLGFALTVILTWLNPEHKYLGSIYSQVITGGVFMVYIVYQLRPYYTFSFKKAHIRYMLAYSVPLIPYFLSSVILGQFDRVMIAQYTNVSDAGLYSFAYNIGMLLALVFSALNSAWIPKYYKLMDDKDVNEIDGQVNFMHRLLLCVALGLVFFGEDLGKLLGSNSFYASLPLIPIVVIGHLFMCYFYFWMWNIDYAKKSLYSSLVIVLAGVINIVLNAIFIPRFGYIAAAYTTMVAYLCMAIFSWVVNHFIIKLHSIAIKKLVKPFLLFALFIVLTYGLLYVDWGWFEILVKIVLLGGFAYLLFANQVQLLASQYFKR